jgi:unsaturated chondroitin disaccharide hydrolase
VYGDSATKRNFLSHIASSLSGISLCILLVVIFKPHQLYIQLNSCVMIHLRHQLSACLLFVFLMACTSTKVVTSTKPDPALLSLISRNMSDAAAQYKVMMQALPAGRFPKTYYPKVNRLETSGSDWWCSGFYPGTLLFLHQQTKDAALLAEAERMLALLEKEKNNTSTHDLGFMMFCSFGNALEIAPRPGYRDILLTSARSLSTRFNPAVGCIKSWDSKPSDFLVIIDNMMNLKLLFWATEVSGDSSFYKIAVTHANTTIQNHFRPDYSSYHVVNYNPQTGAVQQRKTAQGLQ